MENTSFVCKREPPWVDPEVHHEEIIAPESESIDIQSLNSIPKSSPNLILKHLRKRNLNFWNFCIVFEEDLFKDFRNTSNYFCQKRPPDPITPSELCEKKFLRETIKELTTLMSDEWLREGELSSKPLQIFHPSSLIQCRIKDQNVEALYNPTVGANIMSDNFTLGCSKMCPYGTKTLRQA
jgi:hypothetical protein